MQLVHRKPTFDCASRVYCREQCYKIIGFRPQSLIELAWLIAEKTSQDYTLVIWDRTFRTELIIAKVPHTIFFFSILENHVPQWHVLEITRIMVLIHVSLIYLPKHIHAIVLQTHLNYCVISDFNVVWC